MKPIVKYMWATPLRRGVQYRSVLERDTITAALKIKPGKEDCERISAVGAPVLIRATTTFEEVELCADRTPKKAKI